MVRILQNENINSSLLKEMSPDEVEWVYNALDCCVTHEIFSEQEKNLDDIARRTENFSYALMAPVMEMSLRGTLIYEAEREKVLADFTEEFKRVHRNLMRIVREGIGLTEFNYASPKQVANLFYRILGIKPIKARSSTGVWSESTGRDALEKIQINLVAAPLAKHIITLRELSKKINMLKTAGEAPRWYTSYNIAGTNTGRFSSSDSDFGEGGNSQNIERRLRRIFIPDEGMKFCNIDLEQADSRNVGAICWDVFVESHGEEFAGSYLDACESGDLHTYVCRMWKPELEWGDDPSKFKEIADAHASWYREWSYRDGAKKLGHGTNYYGLARTMATHTKVATAIIAEFQEKYFGAFPVIGDKDHRDPKWNRETETYEYENWHQYVRVCLEHTGYIITPHFRRRRFFWGRPEDGTTLRAAIAYGPQSMTADEINTGILRVWRTLPEVQLLIQVHDSILVQYPERDEDEIIPKLLEALTIKWDLKRGRPFYVPVEAKIGWNWDDRFERGGKVENPFGLTAWRGPGADERKRPKFRELKGSTLSDFLDA